MSESDIADDADLRGRAIRGASAVMAGQVLRFAISMGSQIYVARLLLPADFGLVAMIGPIVGFVQLFSDFGLLQAVVQRRTVTQALLSTVFWINMVISLGLALLFAVLTPILVLFYAEPRLMAIGLVSSVMILVSGVGQLPGALLARQLRFGVATVIEITTQFAGLAAAIIGALHGLSYWTLILSPVVSSCLSTILTIAVVRWRPSRPGRDPDAMGMLRFGGQITGTKVIGYLNTSADNMMIGAVLGGVALGLYDRGWRLAALSMWQLCAPVDRLAMPVLSRLVDDPDRYRRAFRQMVALLLMMAMPGLLYGTVAADRLIPTLLGAQWIGAIPVFRWVCAGAIAAPLGSATSWLMLSQGRGPDCLRYTAIVSVINVAAYALGLSHGLAGVAATSAISVYLIQVPILIGGATRSGPVGPRLFLRSITPVVLVVALTCPLLYWFVHQLPPVSFVAVVAGGAAAYVVPLFFMLFFAAGRETLALAWNVVPLWIRRLLTGTAVWTRA